MTHVLSHLPHSVLVAAIALIVCMLPVEMRAQRMTLSDRGAKPVVVETADIRAEISGRLAVTTFDLVFRNPNDRVLEGTFAFPLLDGQTIVRFGLDIGGNLREAVPVEKTRGRIVFEEIERRRVDPGLLEQTAGNNYRARVFPIPARGTRRIVLAYQEDLSRGDSAHPVYRLALDFPEALERFRVTATVSGAVGDEPRARTTWHRPLPSWRGGRVLAIDERDVAPRGVLEVDLPRLVRPTFVTEQRNGRDFFVAEAPISEVAPGARPAPRVAGLLWDSSGSRAAADHEREFALLAAWFDEVRDVEVRLVQLRECASAAASFVVRGGDWSALRAELRKITYDGATSFDGLLDDATVDEWLLFSDGLVNFGAHAAPAQLPVRGVVHAILTSAEADPAYLRGLALRHAGEFVNLVAQEPEDASAQLCTYSLRLLAVEHDPDAVVQVFPAVGTPVTSGSCTIAGILRAPEATVRLRIGHTEADSQTVEVNLVRGENPGALAARAWGAAKIDALSVNLSVHRAEIRRTGEEFGLCAAGSSLIVLETLQDYARYRIDPPEELRGNWKDLRLLAESSQARARAVHLEQLVWAWQRRVAWWRHGFSKADLEVVPPAPHPDSGVPMPAGLTLALQDVATSSGAGLDWERVIEVGSESEDMVVLSPFMVEASADEGYRASNTLAGSRMGSGGNGQRRLSARPVTPARTPGEIVLRRWSPRAPYLDRLRKARPEARHAIYLAERPDHVDQPGFFLDVAEFFFEHGEPATAVRVLSNLAELELEDAPMLRALARRLDQAGRAELALPIFERVLALRPEEPQSRRDLALACAATGEHQRAVDLLWEIVAQPWDARFPAIGLIALEEMNAIIATCGRDLDLARVDARLRDNLPLGMRVVVTWDANDCDMDLWVDDPNGERARYDHPRTFQGGLLSPDFTGGYGPEEFGLRGPKPGDYHVRLNYYDDGRQNAFGPVTAQVRLITDFGTRAQRERSVSVRLTRRSETLDIGTIVVTPDS